MGSRRCLAEGGGAAGRGEGEGGLAEQSIAGVAVVIITVMIMRDNGIDNINKNNITYDNNDKK